MVTRWWPDVTEVPDDLLVPYLVLSLELCGWLESAEAAGVKWVVTICSLDMNDVVYLPFR